MIQNVIPETGSHVSLRNDFVASKHVKVLNFDAVRPDRAEELYLVISISLANVDKQANVEADIAP